MDQLFVEKRHRDQERLLRSLAGEVLARYPLVRSTLRLLQFEDNAVYLVESAGRRFVLRMSVIDGRSAAMQASEVAWLEALAQGGHVLVPVPLRTTDGESIVSSQLAGSPEPVISVVFEWIPGSASPEAFRPGVAAAWGTATAQLHRHASTYQPPAGFVRPTWGLEQIFADGATLTDSLAATRVSAGDRKMLAEIGERVAARLPGRSPDEWGLIHADLHRENVVRTPVGGPAVIDFDDCGWGFFMLDVATVCSSALRTCLDDRAAYARFVAAYLTGYRSVRELPPSAVDLDTFLVMRDMIILNFVTGSRNEEVLGWAAERTRGILDLMRNYAMTGIYDGHLSES